MMLLLLMMMIFMNSVLRLKSWITFSFKSSIKEDYSIILNVFVYTSKPSLIIVTNWVCMHACLPCLCLSQSACFLIIIFVVIFSCSETGIRFRAEVGSFYHPLVRLVCFYAFKKTCHTQSQQSSRNIQLYIRVI